MKSSRIPPIAEEIGFFANIACDAEEQNLGQTCPIGFRPNPILMANNTGYFVSFISNYSNGIVSFTILIVGFARKKVFGICRDIFSRVAMREVFQPTEKTRTKKTTGPGANRNNEQK